MRKLATLAAAAGAGLVLTLIATTPSMAQAVHLQSAAKAAPILQDGGHQGNAHRTLVRFRGGIGVQPVSAGNGQALVADTVNRNIVRGVQPAGQPWRIADFRATVEADGHITARGSGLVFAGGNTIGTALTINTATGGTAANVRVFATLICENVATFVERDTNLNGVPLAANGDFTIDDVLSPPPPANACATPVLFIRNTANLTWFAVGIQKFADN